DDPDVDAAAGGQLEGAREDLVGDEVRRHHPDPLAGGEQQGDQRLVEGVAFDVGAAGDDLHGDAAFRVGRGGGVRGGGAVGGRGGLAGGERPVGPEQGVEVVGGGARDHDRDVAPAVRVGDRPHVLLGEVHPAGQGGAAVGDDDL